MKTVRLFDMLSYDGYTWQVVAQDGPELALKELISGRIRKIGVSELLGDESFLPDAPDRLPRLDSAAALETLDPAARERVMFLRRHVVEVLTGRPPAEIDGPDEDSPTPIRREYDSRIPLKDRIAAKVAELAAAKTPVGHRSLNGTSRPTVRTAWPAWSTGGCSGSPHPPDGSTLRWFPFSRTR